jgi:hypothetical protein
MTFIASNHVFNKTTVSLAKQRKLKEDYCSSLVRKIHEFSASEKLLRTLNLLKNFVEEPQKSNQLSQSKEFQFPVQLKVFPIKGFSHNVSYFWISVFPTITVEELKHKITERARDLNPKVKSVKLYYGTSSLKDKNKLLSELEIGNRSTLYYDIKESEVLLKKKEDETLSPRFVFCSHQENLSSLFDVLDKCKSDSSICQKAWEILNLLPTNPVHLKQLFILAKLNFGKKEKSEVFGEPENLSWERVLAPDSDYRLLYYLQLIESLSRDAVSEQYSVNDVSLTRVIEPIGLRR